MSLIQSIYATLLTHLQKFPSLKQEERQILLRDCYTYMGSNLMRALSILEFTPKKLSITQYPMFYLMLLDKQRFLLFKDRMTLLDPDVHKVFKFDFECCCEQSWNRKTDKKAPFLCLHQILMYLIQGMKCHDIKIQKGLHENMDDLGQILLFLK